MCHPLWVSECPLCEVCLGLGSWKGDRIETRLDSPGHGSPTSLPYVGHLQTSSCIFCLASATGSPTQANRMQKPLNSNHRSTPHMEFMSRTVRAKLEVTKTIPPLCDCVLCKKNISTCAEGRSGCRLKLGVPRQTSQRPRGPRLASPQPSKNPCSALWKARQWSLSPGPLGASVRPPANPV